MSGRKQELQALLDKVEAGESPWIEPDDLRMCFVPPRLMMRAYMGDLNAAVALINAMLPGWWWSIGTCKVSDDARVSPEGEASVRNGKEWSEITDVDLRPPGNPARALLMSGLIALIELEGGAHE